jgi:hypothetical protein
LVTSNKENSSWEAVQLYMKNGSMSSEYMHNTYIYKFKGGTANLLMGIQNSDIQVYSTRLCMYISMVLTQIQKILIS